MTPVDLNIAEGETGRYTLKLASQPSEDVTVKFLTYPIVRATPTELTFTTEDWNDTQTVKVAADDDNDSLDAWAAVLHQIVGESSANWTFVRVVVDDQDTPLAVSGSTSADYVENGNSPVATYSVTNTGNGNVSWRLFGDDKNDFSINSSGELTFTTPPDHENPADADGDNVYRVTVHASNGTSTGVLLGVEINVTDEGEPPTAPGAPTVSGKTGTFDSLDVTWTAPTNTGKPNIDSYDLRYIGSDAENKADFNWSEGPQDQTDTSATITDLDSGRPYDVQVLATNADGDSPWSTTGMGRTNTPNDAPAFLSNETGIRSVAENTALGVSIGAPVAANDQDNDTLTYSLGRTDAESFSIVTTTGQLLTNAELDYEGRSTYRVTVSVLDGLDANGNPDTATDDSIGVTIGVTNLDEPGTVTLSPNQPKVDTSQVATLEDPDGHLSSVSWEWEKSSDKANWATVVGATSDSYTPRQSDVGHYLRANASYTDGHGSGKSAQAETGNKVQTVPGPPAIESVSPNDRTLTVSWTAPAADGGTAITTYDLRYIRSDASDKTDASWTSKAGVWTSGALRYTLGSLNNGVEYDLQVRAVNAVGGGSWSSRAIGTPRTTPGTPAISSVTSGDRVLTVSWFAPGNDGGAEITGYDLRYIRSDASDKADENWMVEEGIWNSGVLRYELSGLTNGVDYDLQLRAVNIAGDGEWSGSTSGAPQTRPAAPTINSMDSGNNFLTVTWSPPTDTGGLNIQSYDLRYIRSDALDKADDDWTGRESIWTSGNLEYTLSGLSNGVGYDLQVRAVTSAEDGPWSATAAGTPQTTPDAPSINPISPGNRTLSVAWSAPSNTGGAAIASYDLRYIRSDAPNKTDANWTGREAIWTSGNLQYTLSSLTNGIEYDIQVRAVNAVGNGSWSATATGTPQTTADAPSIDLITPGNRALSAAWSAPSNTGGFAIISYDMRYIRNDASDKVDPNNWTLREDIWESGSLEHTITGLTNEVEYDVQVRAVDAVGNGPWSASAIGTPAPGQDGTTNAAPVFTEGTRTVRSVAENVTAGTNLGSPVEATDADDDTLTYTLSGVDAESFDIDASAGQLQTKATLDAEMKSSYTVEVTASDSSDSTLTITVIITVTDVDYDCVSGNAVADADNNPGLVSD